MKLVLSIVAALVLTACANESKEENVTAPADSVTTVPAASPEESVAVSAARAFGQSLLDETAQPGNNKETIACLDSLYAVNRDSRDFFFDVYLTISGKTDGVLGETASEKALAYFEQFPREALDNYKQLEKADKAIFTDDLAFEFYANGGNIANDVNECIDGILKNCKECTSDEKLLEELRLELIKKANKIKS